MQKPPLISIIIPVYLAEKYIRKCLESLLNQSYENFEAIIVNDGTPDNSIILAKELVHGDPRFIFFEKENGGQSSARNLGLNHASGSFIAFLDADDYIAPDTFNKCIEHMDLNTDIILFGFQYITDNGKILGKIIPSIYDYSLKKDFLLFEKTIDTSMATKFYRADIFNNERFVEGIIGEDQEILPRILYKRSLKLIPEILYSYVIHEGSSTRRYNRNYLTSLELLFKSHKKFLDANNLSALLNKYYEKGYLLHFYSESITYLSLYSPQYQMDCHSLSHKLNHKITNWINITKLIPLTSPRFWALTLFKISPILFKITFKYLYKKIKKREA